MSEQNPSRENGRPWPPWNPAPPSNDPNNNPRASRGLKRPADDSPPPVVLKSPISAIAKSPFMVLNEEFPQLHQTIKWDLAELDKKPYFRCSAKLNGVVFAGDGWSKKEAKQTMAQRALSQLMPTTPDDPSAHPIFQTPNIPDTSTGRTGPLQAPKLQLSSKFYLPGSCAEKNPVSVLNEWATRADLAVRWMEQTVDGGPPAPQSQFFAVVAVGEREIRGALGGSRKDARINAACAALSHIFNVSMDASWHLRSTPMKVVKMEPPDLPPPSLPRNVPAANAAAVPQMAPAGHRMELVDPMAHRISMLVQRRYLDLCSEQGLTRTADFAGFVLSSGPNEQGLFVLSLGAGCGVGGVVCGSGESLFDTHGVILARRSLLLFFYQQLTKLSDPQRAARSIFEPVSTGGYQLKPNYKVHLYLGSVPPGACEMTVGDGADDLRYYGPDGVSTPSIKSLPLANLPGVVWSEKVMSASDKLLKWNSVGVQGALLAHHIRPVHLQHIILGAPNADPDAVFQGVCGRLSLCRPLVSAISRPDQSFVGRMEGAMSWWRGAAGVERLGVGSGRELSGRPSRLCKRRLFELLGALKDQHVTRIQQTNPYHTIPENYAEAKRASVSYQKKKREFVSKFRTEDLGCWLHKPAELDHFDIIHH